jgi:low temperature requirement protein LtrA
MMVAGIIVSAVGDALVIESPGDRLGTAEVTAIVAGPVIYLTAHTLFRLRMAGSISWKRLFGALACAALGLAGTHMASLLLASLVLGVLVCVIAAEQEAAMRRRRRGESSPLERLEPVS